MRRALEWLGGSFLVYLALAACSGAVAVGTASTPNGDAGAPASSGHANSGGGEVDAPLDMAAGKASGSGGLLDPVPTAMAAAGAGMGGASPVGPAQVTMTAPCDKQLKIGTSNQPVAIFDFPGETTGSLSRAKAILLFAGADISAAEGFIGRVQDFYVKDGQIAVWCTNASESATVTL